MAGFTFGGVGSVGFTVWAVNEIYQGIVHTIQANNDAINVLISLHLK